MRYDCFTDELQLIKNTQIREFIQDFLERCVPNYFYTVPASSSGKYHPQYALGEGGLVRHTKAAVRIAEHLLSLEQNEELNSKSHDEIISALIVHDSFKHGVGHGGNTVFQHPVIAAEVLHSFANEFHPEMLEVAKSIGLLVKSHMGQWNQKNFEHGGIVLPKPKTTAQKFVHMCDYLASRKDITVDVSYEP